MEMIKDGRFLGGKNRSCTDRRIDDSLLNCILSKSRISGGTLLSNRQTLTCLLSPHFLGRVLLTRSQYLLKKDLGAWTFITFQACHSHPEMIFFSLFTWPAPCWIDNPLLVGTLFFL